MSSCCWLLIGLQLLLCRRWLYNTVWIIDYHKLFLRFPRKKYQICPYSDAFKIRRITLFQKDEFLGLLWLQNRKKWKKRLLWFVLIKLQYMILLVMFFLLIYGKMKESDPVVPKKLCFLNGCNYLHKLSIGD